MRSARSKPAATASTVARWGSIAAARTLPSFEPARPEELIDDERGTIAGTPRARSAPWCPRRRGGRSPHTARRVAMRLGPATCTRAWRTAANRSPCTISRTFTRRCPPTARSSVESGGTGIDPKPIARSAADRRRGTPGRLTERLRLARRTRRRETPPPARRSAGKCGDAA